MLKFILQRIQSSILAKWWLFYRPYFDSDDACLHFIYSVLKNEPEQDEIFKDLSCMEEYDEAFIPRRMLTTIIRMVSSAREMDKIHRGRDVFKIVFLITCVEKLQKLGGRNENKGKLVNDFFYENMTREHQKLILSKFRRSLADCSYDNVGQEKPITIQEFAAILNELRNCATHDEDFWEMCFNNNKDSDVWLQIQVNIDLENFSRKDKVIHIYETTLTYNEFEELFVQTCIQYVFKFINNQNER